MAELIVALDHRDAASAFACLDRLPEGCAVKVGSILFTAAGPGLVRGLVDQRHSVFLDLKWHDIPHTVAHAVAAAADLGVEMVTVHAHGGTTMMAQAAESARGGLRVVAVTILTSHDAAGYGEVIGVRDPDLGLAVERLARLAVDAGLDGVVCSPEEIVRVRPIIGAGRIVVPGIRRSGDAAGDQRRVASPEAAVAAGATHLVVGRPITDAGEPGDAWRAFAALAGDRR